jgi:hypothetical protein
MMRGERARLHFVLLALVAVNWIIALVQVRGAEFSNLLAIPPLALLLAELRRISAADTEDMGAAFFYVAATLLSAPAVWAVGGALASNGIANSFSAPVAKAEETGECISRDALAPLAGLDPGVVSAPSNLGSPILRFTPHRVLSGPYHRDQGGMLTELHIGLAEPKEAEAFMRGAHVTLLAFCASDPQVKEVSKLKPDGLYAQLGQGHVPAYLQPIPTAAKSGVQFFRFAPAD